MTRFLARGAFLAIGLCLSFVPLRAAAELAEDPCATVPRSLVASVLGAPIVVAEPRTVGESRSCGYRTSPDGPFTIITAFRYASIAAAEAGLKEQTSGAEGVHVLPAVPARGFGDHAISVAGLLFVRKGRAMYVFGMIADRPQAYPAPSTQRLARRVLPLVKP